MTVDTLKQVRDDYMRKVKMAQRVMKKAKDAYQVKLVEDDIASFQDKIDELNAEIAEEKADVQ